MSFYLDRPLNFAHRGACKQAPENTVPAFVLAADLGADGIELDVQLSKDGEVVVIHDFQLDATTDGTGPVRDCTLAELKEFDAGVRFDPACAGERIPTLQEVIDAVGHRLLINIELKAQGVRDDGLAAAVVSVVERNDLVARVILSSFNPLTLRRAGRLNPKIPLGLLYAPDQPLFLRRPWLRRTIPLEAVHPYHGLVDAGYIEWAKKQGYRVNVWTVDEVERMQQLRRLAVDVIITNWPDRLGRVLQTA